MIRRLLREEWSPEQIQYRLKHEKNSLQISYTTIYRALSSGQIDGHSPGYIRKCDRYSFHLRRSGTNENTNGLLRQYFPKETSFDDVSDAQLADVVAKINLRPRKCLNWLSPFEVFFDTLLHLTRQSKSDISRLLRRFAEKQQEVRLIFRTSCQTVVFYCLLYLSQLFSTFKLFICNGF